MFKEKCQTCKYVVEIDEPWGYWTECEIDETHPDYDNLPDSWSDEYGDTKPCPGWINGKV